MKAVCQIVDNAVLYESGNEISKIGRGLLVYIGFSRNDTIGAFDKALNRICGLRIFEDDNHKLNLSLENIGGQLLLVSNFTLYGNCSDGFRPSFTASAGFEQAKALYEYSIDYMRNRGIDVFTGVFGGDMLITSDANGPINILIDSEEI